MNQQELRKIVRVERRMEFAFEGLRYKDLIRWGIAEKALNRPNYGLLDPEPLRQRVVNQGNWFLPYGPEIDEDGIPSYTQLVNEQLIKQITDRNFDSRQYLMPIPASEIQINKNLEQNPGY